MIEIGMVDFRVEKLTLMQFVNSFIGENGFQY